MVDESERRTEGRRNTDDNGLALDLLGEVDLVTGGVLDEHIEIGDGVAFLNEGGSGVVEEGTLRQGAGKTGGETASGEHGGRCRGKLWEREPV